MPRKGGDFERAICRQLTSWWTGDPEADVIFWRTSQSGGRVTQRAKSKKKLSKSHCGDISALGEEGKPLTDLLVLELKRGYPKASIHALLDKTPDSATQTYEEWIEQAKTSANQAEAPFWLIVHKRNGRAATVTMPEKLWMELEYLGIKAGNVIRGPMFHLEFDKEDLVCCQWDAFLNMVSPQTIRYLAEKHGASVLASAGG